MADIRKIIEDYLANTKMMQLATSIDAQPWICNVWFASDEDLNIYWFSSTTRRHSNEVLKNNKVAAAIVAPQTPQDTPRGLQLQGHAEVLTNDEDVKIARSVYEGRIFDAATIDSLIKNKEKPHKFYRIKPTQFVLFDGENFCDNWRQEYNL